MNRLLRSFMTLVAVISVILMPALVSAQTTNVGTWKGVNVERGDNYVLAFPNNGKPTHPLVLFNAPYTVDSKDAGWAAKVRSAGMYLDVSLPADKICNGDCVTYVVPATADNDLSNLGNVVPGNTLLDQLFDEGYAVAVLRNRHYLGRNALSLMLEVQQAVISIKSDLRVTKDQIVIVGMSQGGQLAIHPFTFPGGVPGGIASDDPRMRIAGAVSVGGWMEPVDMWEFMQKNAWFFNSFKSRWAASFGMNPAGWGGISYDSLASRFHTPLLMIHGTDDCMVPSRQADGFFSAIKARGGSVNKWVYRNGPCNTGLPITSSGHGKFDQGSSVKMMRLIDNFIRTRMPLGKDVSDDGNALPAMLDELAEAFVIGADQANVLDLIAQASNPRIKYVSSDLRFNGAGDTIVPARWAETLTAWQARMTASRVPEEIDIPSLFRGYISEYCLPKTTWPRRAQIVGLVLMRADPTIMYVVSDEAIKKSFPSARGDVFVPAASNFVVAEFFAAPGRRCGY